MLKRVLIVSAMFCLAGTAQAQWSPGTAGMAGGISYQSTPTISPYLQLTRPGGSTTLNYVGLTRPTFDFQRAIGGLQQQVSDFQSTGSATDNGLLTGGRTRFLNTGNFFMNINGQGSTGSIGRGNNIILVSPQQNQQQTTNFQGMAPGMINQQRQR
jgi:hypothetical protein